MSCLITLDAPFSNLLKCKIFQFFLNRNKSIVHKLGVHKSTVSRELYRNKGKKGYRYNQAHEQAKSRRYQVSSQRKKS